MALEGATKNRILGLLSTGNKTLSDISTELGLSKATVSQHLQELKDMGAIEEADPNNTRKWKYYRLNPNFNYNEVPFGKNVIVSKISKRVFYYVIGILVVACAILYLASPHGAQPAAPGTVITQAQNTSSASQIQNIPAVARNQNSNLTQYLNVSNVQDYNYTFNDSSDQLANDSALSFPSGNQASKSNP